MVWLLLAAWLALIGVTDAFDLGHARTLSSFRNVRSASRCRPVCTEVISPFDGGSSRGAGPVQGPLALTAENVELVLEEMRPYLMADGGNVALRDIDGATVSKAEHFVVLSGAWWKT